MTHLGVVKKYTKIDFGIIIFNVADEGNRSTKVFCYLILRDALFFTQLFHTFSYFFEINLFYCFHILVLLA